MISNKNKLKYLIILIGQITISQIQATYYPIAHNTYTIQGRQKTIQNAHFPKCDITNKEANKPYITKNKSYIYGLFDGHKEDHAAKFCAYYFPQELDKQTLFHSTTKTNIKNAFFTINKNYKNYYTEISNRCCCDCFYDFFNYFNNCGYRSNQVQPEQITAIPDDGTTALIALITKDNGLYVANVGDSRAVLSKEGKALAVSFDHNPEEESELNRLKTIALQLNQSPHSLVTRAKDQTGNEQLFTYNILEKVDPVTGREEVQQKIDCYFSLNININDKINISRALGYFKFTPYITCEPFISIRYLYGNEEFLILGCNRLWNVITDQAAVNLILYNLSKLKKTKSYLFNTPIDPLEIARILTKILVKKASDLDSKNTITATVILFPAALTSKELKTENQENSEEDRKDTSHYSSRSTSPQNGLGSKIKENSIDLIERRYKERSNNTVYPDENDDNPFGSDEEDFDQV